DRGRQPRTLAPPMCGCGSDPHTPHTSIVRIRQIFHGSPFALLCGETPGFNRRAEPAAPLPGATRSSLSSAGRRIARIGAADGMTSTIRKISTPRAAGALALFLTLCVPRAEAALFDQSASAARLEAAFIMNFVKFTE